MQMGFGLARGETDNIIFATKVGLYSGQFVVHGKTIGTIHAVFDWLSERGGLIIVARCSRLPTDQEMIALAILVHSEATMTCWRELREALREILLSREYPRQTRSAAITPLV